MSKVVIASAGNTLAPALAILREMGYEVSRLSKSSRLLQAEDGKVRLIADDTLQLLGLASLASRRGAAWQPTEREISDLLDLESGCPY